MTLTLLTKYGLAGAIATDSATVRYITHCAVSEGIVFISRNGLYLFVDNRYALIAKGLPKDIKTVFGRKEKIEKELAHLLSSGEGKIAFHGKKISFSFYQNLVKLVPSIQLVEHIPFFSQLRRQKASWEIDAIERACQLCEEGFLIIKQTLREGVKEKEIERVLKHFWFSRGAENLSFNPIIAFGKNAACPHWTPSHTPLKKGDVVLIDIGVQIDGYHSDMTRTLFYGEVDPELYICFEHVRTALEKAVSMAKEGIFPSALDAMVRSYFDSVGYGTRYIHALGHGVGLEVHESPRIHFQANEGPLVQGDIITLEPGLYIEGKGGIRLENTYVVEVMGVRNLMKTPLFY